MYSGKSKSELISELQKIKKEYGLLKKSYKEAIEKSNKLELEISQSKDSISNNENRFRAFIEQAPVAIGVFSLEGLGMYANQKYLETLGLKSLDEFIGRPAYEYFAPQFREESKERTRRRLAGLPVPPEYESVALRADGTEYPCRLAVAPIQMSGGIVSIAFLTDITDQKKLNEELVKAKENAEENEYKFRTAFMTGANANVIVGRDNGIIVEVNDRMVELYGYSREEFIGHHTHELGLWVYPEERQKMVEILRSEGRIYNLEVLARRKGGETFWVQYSVNELYNDGEPLIFGSIQDITDRKLAESELIKAKEKAEISELRYKLLFNTIPESVILIGNDRCIIEANRASALLYGYESPEQLVGLDTRLFISEKDRERASRIQTNVIQNQVHEPRQYIEVRRDGSEFFAELISTTLFGLNNEILGYIGISRDISDSKQAEEALKRSERELRKAQEITHIGSFYIDLETNQVTWSEELYKMFGLDPTQPPPLLNDSQTLFMPDSWELFSNSISKAATSGIPYELELRMVRQNESYGWIWASGEAIKDKNGKITAISGVVQDITTRKNQQEELIKAKEKAEISELRYKLLFNTIPESVLLIGNDRCIIEANQASALLYGYESPDQLIGLDTRLLISEKDRERASQTQKNVIQNNEHKSRQYIEVRRDGSEFYAEITSTTLFGLNNEILGYIGITRDISERKKSEEELIKAKEKAEKNEHKIKEQSIEIENFFTNAIDLLCIANTDGYFLRLNKEWENTLGYSISELEGKRFLDFIHPDDLDATLNAISQLNKQINVLNFTNRYLNKNGTYRWIEWKSYPVDNKIYATARDITHRILIENELTEAKNKAEENEKKVKEQARLLDLIFTHSLDCIAILDSDYNFIKVSTAYAEADKKEVTDFIGKNHFEMYPSDFKQEADDVKEKKYIYKNQSRPFVYAEHPEWGTSFWDISFVPVLDSNQDIELFILTLKDVTNKYTAELKLIEQKTEIELHNERLESLLRISQYQTNSIQELLDYALSEAINLTDSKIGYIYFYNENTKQFTLNTRSKDVMKECTAKYPQTIYDLDKTGLWGEPVRQRKAIIINDYQANNPYKKGIPEGHVSLKKFLTIPVIFENKIVAVAGVANKKTDYNSSDIRQLTLLMDNVWKISERILLVDNLKSAKEKAEESDRLKTAFLQNMSHEIRTPMNAIMGFAELIPRKLNDKEKIEYFSTIITQRCNDLLDIINDILDIAKIESGQLTANFEHCDINKLFSDINSIFKAHQNRIKKNHISFEIAINCKLDNLIIITDPVKLKQIFINLLTNAFKFTDEGKVEAGCISVTDQELIFYVSDTGIGISPEKHEFIFERFSQIGGYATNRLYGGNGLGLPIVKGLVNLLGGKVWLESEPGKGTTFYFSINYKQDIISEKLIPEPEYSENYNALINKTVLIVEDDTYNKSLIIEMLSNLGLNLLYADNGSEAIQKALEHSPDLILMDIGLPDITGYEAITKILSKNSRIKIIAQTAYASSSDKEVALKSGCIDYISKPIKEKALLAILTKHLS